MIFATFRSSFEHQQMKMYRFALSCARQFFFFFYLFFLLFLLFLFVLFCFRPSSPSDFSYSSYVYSSFYSLSSVSSFLGHDPAGQVFSSVGTTCANARCNCEISNAGGAGRQSRRHSQGKYPAVSHVFLPFTLPLAISNGIMLVAVDAVI